MSIELSLIAFVAILADDDDQQRNAEVIIPQKVFLRKVTYSDWQVALSILPIDHDGQMSISPVKCQAGHDIS